MERHNQQSPLFIPELYMLVCEQLDKQTLCSLARVCSGMSEAPLDLIWKDVEGLSKLVMCLPQDAWALTQAPQGFQSYIAIVLQRPLKPSDFTRLLSYAQRMKTFSVQAEGTNYLIHKNIVDALLLCMPSLPIAPRLKTFTATLDPTNLSLVQATRLFLGHNITMISLSAGVSTQVMCLMNNIPVVCPNVLYFGMAPYAVELTGTVSAMIMQWTELREIMAGTLTDEALHYITRLKDFKHFYMHTSPYQKNPEQLPSFPKFALDHQTIHLENTLPVVSNAASILLPKMRVRSAAFHVVLDTSAKQAGELHKHLARLLIPSAEKKVLEHLTVHYNPGRLQVLSLPPMHYNIHISHLAPFFRFSKLRAFHFHTLLDYAITDVDFPQLASAWPDIEVLQLTSSARYPSLSRMTLRSMATLALHCKQLTHLALHINTANVPRVPKPPGGEPAWENKLRTFDVQASNIPDALQVSEYLSYLFPVLENIIVPGTHGPEDLEWGRVYRKWTDSKHLMETWRGIRMHGGVWRNRQKTKLMKQRSIGSLE